MDGVVRKVVRDKGFGFITGRDGKDYFFHHSKLRGGLNIDNIDEGEEVSFEDAHGPKGTYAEDIYRA